MRRLFFSTILYKEFRVDPGFVAHDSVVHLPTGGMVSSRLLHADKGPSSFYLPFFWRDPTLFHLWLLCTYVPWVPQGSLGRGNIASEMKLPRT